MRINSQQMATKRPLRKRHLRKRHLGKRHLGRGHLGKRHLGKRHLGKTHLRADEEIAASVVMTEHDYGSAPKPGALDAAAARIQQLEETVKELTRAVTAESGSSAFSQILCLRQGHPFLHQIHIKRCFL
ncbi:unnamed protein product [Boreogadus saida]